MIKKTEIPVIITCAANNSNSAVMTSVSGNQAKKFLKNLYGERTDKDDKCTFSVAITEQTKREIHIPVSGYSNRKESSSIKDIKINILPDSLMQCDCKSKVNCPKHIMSGKCFSLFIKHHICKDLLNQK
jgi:hypothetical protein